MKPSSFSWLLSVKSDREPDEGRQHVAFLRDVAGVSTPVASSTPRPRNATAVESRPSVAASPQSTTMPAKVAATIFS